MLRVLHIHFGKDGGAEKFFVHLLQGLADARVEQKVVIRPGRAWKSRIPEGVEIIESHFRTVSLDRILLPLRIRQLARRWRPDGMLAWMPKAAKLLPATGAFHKAVRLGDYPTTLRKFRTVDTVVCNTPGIAQHVADMGWQRGLEVISNFTDARAALPVDRATLDTPAGAFVISSAGRFVPRKGFDVLIRAIERLPDAFLWLVGTGEQEANLKALAESLHVDRRVRFLGWQNDPLPYVAASDCFAMASSHEPLGNVVLEAWAQKVPVVSTRAEGPSWFMNDGSDGILVPIGDHEAFAQAFQRIREDKAFAARLVEGGSETLDRRFSRAAVVNSYIELLSRRASS